MLRRQKLLGAGHDLGYDPPMLIHSVYFWLKSEGDAALSHRFHGGLAKLVTIPDIQAAHFGKPAATEKRAVIDDTYDWALIETFADAAAHDRYQAHPLHRAFVEEFGPSWDKVQVYDVQV